MNEELLRLILRLGMTLPAEFLQTVDRAIELAIEHGKTLAQTPAPTGADHPQPNSER